MLASHARDIQMQNLQRARVLFEVHQVCYSICMIKRNQDGAVSGLAVSLVFAVLLLIGALVFGGWAYMSRQDYKDNVDAKIQTAVEVAKQQESTAKDKQFVEKEKQPLRTYNGPEAYGSISLSFPKTWSAYVGDKPTSGNTNPVAGYFHPNVVPSVADATSSYALRLKVLSQSYSSTVSDLSSSQRDGGKLQISAYALPKVPTVVGVRVSGNLSENKTGTMIVLPLRSQTIELITDGNQFLSDFDNIILPNVTFIP